MGFAIYFVRISDGLDVSYQGEVSVKDDSWISDLWWMDEVSKNTNDLKV